MAKTTGYQLASSEAQTPKEADPLFSMLMLLGKYGVTDSMLQRKYNLNRASLNRVRKGGHLTYAHEHYFKTLLRELEQWRLLFRARMDEKNHRLIKDTMFEVMLQENGIRTTDCNEMGM